ncbi:MAG: hypothetical protein LC121_06810 [Anaerolineae bacterium]|nr:hypothetical protein [Anaerolineae bacterium]
MHTLQLRRCAAPAPKRSWFMASSFYLEKAILPAHQVGVQVLADRYGNRVHLEEREGSLLRNGQKVIEESPAPCLSSDQRAALWAAALEIAALFGHENIATVEFLVDDARNFYFAEIKPRLQVEHPLTEMRTRIDLVREQIRAAAGEPLGFAQADIHPRGWAILCRVNAEDPLNQLPSPGAVRVRLPFGAEVRVDTYIADHGWVPHDYNPLIAKVTVWAAERETCLNRMLRALQDFWLPGGRTNLPLLRQMLEVPGVRAGDYFVRPQEQPQAHDEVYLRDLAVVAATLHSGRYRTAVDSAVPERVLSGWHLDSRRLPE